MRKKETEKPQYPFWRTLFPYLKPHIPLVSLAMLLNGVCGAAIAIQPLVIGWIVDNGILGTKYEGRRFYAISVAIAVYLLMSITRIVTWRISTRCMMRFMEDTMLSLRCRFFSHVQSLCMSFFDHTSAGELYTDLMGSPMGNIRNYIYTLIMNVPMQLISMAVSLYALFSYDWLLTTILLLSTAIMIIFNRFSRTRIRKLAQTNLEAETNASRYISDILQGMSAVKLYSIERDALQKFQSFMYELRDKSMRATILNLMENMKPEMVTYCCTATIYAIGSWRCISGVMEVGMLTAFLNSMGSIMGNVSAFLTLSLTASSAGASLDKIFKVIHTGTTTPEVTNERRRSLSECRDENIKAGGSCIEFDNVTFAYENKKVFDHFNCRIPYHQSVALVGSSGSGKSTFANLVLRLYEVQSGTVRIHGHCVRHFDTHELRTSFGVVPQNPFIFNGTVWENVSIVNPKATKEEVIQAMKMAHIYDFIQTLPDGVNTIIGEGAVKFSGGQKQRIAIARAILKKPDIFIFDEATSALDNISERHIQAAMEELMQSHTMLIVAHRLSTIRNVDRILVFNEGKIVQEGNWATLSHEPGLFRSMLDCADVEEEAVEKV